MIRRLRRADLGRASALIQNTLLVTNSSDYDLEVVGNLVAAFSPANLSLLARKRQIFVYEDDQRLCGIVGLEAGKVCNFFVAPDLQGRGIGRALLAFVEELAGRRGLNRLTLDSSLTAVSFYEALGFVRVGQQEDERYGRTIAMEKRLPGVGAR